jgi:hypothetical protein
MHGRHPPHTPLTAPPGKWRFIPIRPDADRGKRRAAVACRFYPERTGRSESAESGILELRFFLLGYHSQECYLQFEASEAGDPACGCRAVRRALIPSVPAAAPLGVQPSPGTGGPGENSPRPHQGETRSIADDQTPSSSPNSEQPPRRCDTRGVSGGPLWPSAWSAPGLPSGVPGRVSTSVRGERFVIRLPGVDRGPSATRLASAGIRPLGLRSQIHPVVRGRVVVT